MYAIETYFIGPTNSRSSRIAARVMDRGTSWRNAIGERQPARKIILHWDHALSAPGNHIRAAKALAAKLGWAGEWVEGGADDGASVWINAARCWDRFTVEEGAP